MKRHGNYGNNYDGPRNYDRSGPPRGERSYDRAERGFDGPRFGERRGGGESRYEDRPQRSSFRANDGRQGGYGRPQRFGGGEDRGFGRGGPRNFDKPFERKERPSFGPPRERIVPAHKLKEGIGEANRALAGLIEQFGSSLEGDYDIGSLEVTVSFNEDGKFLGFGRGGAASMVLSLSPLDAEEIIESAGEADEADEVSFEGAQGAEQLDNDDMLEAAAELIDMDDDDAEPSVSHAAQSSEEASKS